MALVSYRCQYCHGFFRPQESPDMYKCKECINNKVDKRLKSKPGSAPMFNRTGRV